MTREQVEAMTEEERYVAIAKLCGFVDLFQGNHLCGRRPRPLDGELSIYPVPNYCQDLNACAQIESTLAPLEALENRRAYVWALAGLLGIEGNMDRKWSYVQDFAMVSAKRQAGTALNRIPNGSPNLKHTMPQSKVQLRAALAAANNLHDELCARLLITTMVACERGGNIPLEEAAAACHMTLDNFRVAGQKVDAEAMRMVQNMISNSVCDRCGKPTGATLFSVIPNVAPFFCSRDCLEDAVAQQKEVEEGL